MRHSMALYEGAFLLIFSRLSVQPLFFLPFSPWFFPLFLGTGGGWGGGYGAGGLGGVSVENSHKNKKPFYRVTQFQKSQKYKKTQNIFTLKYIQ